MYRIRMCGSVCVIKGVNKSVICVVKCFLEHALLIRNHGIDLVDQMVVDEHQHIDQDLVVVEMLPNYLEHLMVEEVVE